ncbi:hypothetical protein [Woeseia oceani]|uniref:DUF885 domain-containing protein n=1 Tax=Woeseia oceani TaxID=1548547 RepID=A0A193LK57_9GAMM|nr:hypothetical protein [Woeseia oceani]ANO52940.1 hypothetical protein BA177_02730 [Woeseia oceani]
MHKHVLSVLFAIVLAACSSESPSVPVTAPAVQDLNDVAKDYLVLELSMVAHDPSHVDAYFGPENLRLQAEQLQLGLAAIRERATALQATLATWPQYADDDLLGARIKGLQARVNALLTRVAMKQGETFTFDEESRRLFNAVAPDHDASYFEEILREIDALLPGEGTTSDRVNQFYEQFEIPQERLAGVFDAAIQECRRRTLEHIQLTDNESFSTEFVTDKPWSGYNWYQGNSTSLIQVNTDLPIKIERAIDLGCHEGYPGHHVFNLLLEENLVNDQGWLEFSLYPLFSPMSLIAEGSGNYGIRLAFPDSDRIQFEKDVLFPLAGLNTDDADRYYEILDLTKKLSYAGNEAARDYLDGKTDREQAAAWLVRYALSSPERARQRVSFFDTYRSYVINYNLGQDMVANYVERGSADQAERWRRFAEILSSPTLPEDLRQ